MSTFKLIGIAGAGAMGSGIAQVGASAGCQVVVFDNNENALQAAGQRIEESLQTLVSKGKLNAEEAASIQSRCSFSSDLSSLKDCDLIIEAIIEEEAIKKNLYAELEKIIRQDCIIASNTSSITITSLAASCQYPERFCGLHFFNPAQIMKLVEIIPAVQTNPNVTESLLHLMKTWGKQPVRAKDFPGFIVNRIARPFYGEALRIFDEQLAGAAQIDSAMKTIGGFKMGPFELMDFIGHDVNYRVTLSVFNALYQDPRYKPSLTQKSLLDAGWLGKKTKKGFYSYPDMLETFTVQEKISNEDIWNRIFAMLVNEAVDAVYWGICTAQEADHAMKFGANYPNGLIEWGQNYGIEKIIQTLNHLYEKYREDRYRLSPGFEHLT